MSWLRRNKAPDFWVELTDDCFAASVAVRSGHVIEAAPILAYMNGWTLQKVKEHCKNKKWRYEEKDRLLNEHDNMREPTHERSLAIIDVDKKLRRKSLA